MQCMETILHWSHALQEILRLELQWVEATVATHDFISNGGVHRVGYSLGLREVFWLNE